MIFFPTVYRLIPDLVFRNRSLCSLRMISSNKRSLVIYLPVSGCSKGYFLFTSHFKSWNFYSDHFNIEKVNLWGGFFFGSGLFFINVAKSYATMKITLLLMVQEVERSFLPSPIFI